MHEDIDEIDWSEFEETPAELERARIEGGEPWCATSIAGLQYYDYWKSDELGGFVRPQVGDRLQLVRDAGNKRDRNAVQVRWRNQYMLGHLPREVSEDIAPRLDAGESCRAYVLHGGNGDRWSAVAFMAGKACQELHNFRLKQIEKEARKELERDVKAASEQVWGVGYSIGGGGDIFDREDPTGREPTMEQENAQAAFERERWVRQLRREADLLYAFGSSRRETAFLRRHSYILKPSEDPCDEDYLPF